MFRGFRKNEKEFLEKELEEMNEFINSVMNYPFAYGFSMHIRQGGMEQGSSGKEREDVGYESIREPFTTSMLNEMTGEFNITAEMPGIKKEDIEVSATENEVAIKAFGERKYYKKVKTPCQVNPESAKAQYNNGIVEIKIATKEPAKQGMKIKIE